MQPTTIYPYQFQGNLFVSDITQDLVSDDFKGQLPQDFNLTDKDKLADEIALAWGIAKAHWAAFQQGLDRIPAEDVATTVTRNKWVLPLLQCLGYEPVLTNAETIDNQSYAISHRVESGEHKPPLHIVGCRIGLEKRPLSGNPRLSAHALMQEYLNRTEHLWGVVTNGYQWRLLRDSNLMTRLTYVEFDLEQILNGENFAEFGLFYRLFHRSRLPQGMDDADKCLLEYYHQQTLQQGGRVRDGLRDGVENAIEGLANGFLQHPKNDRLREKCAAGEIKATEFYRQLLMLIYRLLFLMVAEARDLLLTDSSEEHRRIYQEYYSVERLRRMSESPRFQREGFQDLWRGLLVTFQLFDENWRGKILGLSPLNGDLFGSKALSYIDGYAIDNYDLLSAIRDLSVYQHQDKKGQSKQTRRVNYEALDVEELGSVYESLLDFHPQITPLLGGVPAGQHIYSAGGFQGFRFELIKGSDRKSTGSYYTPPELVAQLIKTALEPVIADKLSAAVMVRSGTHPQPLRGGEQEREAKEEALLSITICDPSCGSGHFLLAAARRLGKELARVRTGEHQPGLEYIRAATRDVIQNCIYGVDLNPLAVDLCKVALWIEGYNKGYPLSFLDHRIKCGNSLVGVMDLDCLKEGIPEGAYTAVTGDNKAVATRLKKRNKSEQDPIKRQINLFDTSDVQAERDLYTQNASEIGLTSEKTASDVRAKQERYRASRQNSSWYRDYTLCNLWTAAFFMPLVSDLLPTTETLERLMRIGIRESGIEQDKNRLPTPDSRLIDTVNKLAVEKFFFHWCLEFPEVFQDGGFSCILGNPPWDQLQFDPREFFANREPQIADASNMAARDRMIAKLQDLDPSLYAKYQEGKAFVDCQQKFIHDSDRFPLTSFGRINLAPLFAELARKLLCKSGRTGIIVPTGIATDSFTQHFFRDLVERQSLAALIDFENSAPLFAGVHRSYKFSLLSLSNQPTPETQFSFFLTHPRQLEDKQRVFTLTPQDIALLNPNTLNSPVFRTRADAELTRKIYQTVPVLENEKTGVNPWGISFKLMFMMNTDSGLFHDRPSANTLPLYEAKMFHQFDRGWATYEGLDVRDASLTEKQDPDFRVTPRYWVDKQEVDNKLAGKWDKQWLLAFRKITNATNERTAIFSLLPIAALGDSGQLMLLDIDKPDLVACLQANLSSLVFDFVTRQKAGGTNFNFFIVKQLPVLPPESYTPQDIEFISSRVLELVYTAWDMQPFAQDIWEESGIGSRESIIRQWEECNGESNNSILSGSTSLGRGDEIGSDVLPNHQSLSQRGDVWNDFADSQSSSLSTSEHSRGLRAGESGRIHSISENSTGIAQGSGDSSDFVSTSQLDNRADCRASSQTVRNSRQNVTLSDSDNAKQSKIGIQQTDSRLPIPDSRTKEEQIPIPPFTWNPERRAILRAELDAKYAKLYGLTRDELRYILDPSDVYGAEFPSETFRVLKSKELKEYGEYRTQRLVLAAWDEEPTPSPSSEGSRN